MSIIDRYGRRPEPPSRRDRWSAAGVAVGVSTIVAGIALFTGHGLGIIALAFCLIVAFLHANAVEPGKSRARIAAGFLAASAACAALFAIAGAEGMAVRIAGWLVTALYSASLVFGAFARLDWFQRVLAALTAAALVTALVMMPSPPPPERQADWDKFRVMLTVLDADGHPVQGAGAACWSFDTQEVDQGLVNALRSELRADLASATDANGRASIDLTKDPADFVFICGAMRPHREGEANETGESPSVMSLPYPTPPARAVISVELRFDPPAP